MKIKFGISYKINSKNITLINSLTQVTIMRLTINENSFVFNLLTEIYNFESHHIICLKYLYLRSNTFGWKRCSGLI